MQRAYSNFRQIIHRFRNRVELRQKKLTGVCFTPSENSYLLIVSTIDFPSATLVCDVLTSITSILDILRQLAYSTDNHRRSPWTHTCMWTDMQAEANAHTTDEAVRLPVGTLCKFYMRAKLVCGMSLCSVCVPEQGGCVNALNLK